MYFSSNNSHDKLMRERMSKLRELLVILEKCDNDYERAIKLRRIYASYEKFLQAYYQRRKSNKEKTGKICEVVDIFSKYEEQLATLGDLYKNYEQNGFFELAKEEEKFLLRQYGDIDSRYIIKAYVSDPCSYDFDEFSAKYKVSREIFRAALLRIKNHDEDLYAKYLEVFNNNKTKRLVMPIYSINQIIEGITTGKTIDGNKFDKLEFYKLAPFKNKSSIDYEVKGIAEDFPKLQLFKKLKQEYVKEEGKSNSYSYADNLYLFTRCFSEEQSKILKDWMDKNNIKNLTPIHRASTVNCYYKSNNEEFFKMEDANEIFDIIEENNYPKIYEVYNILKEEKINKKKLLSLKENE